MLLNSFLFADDIPKKFDNIKFQRELKGITMFVDKVHTQLLLQKSAGNVFGIPATIKSITKMALGKWENSLNLNYYLIISVNPNVCELHHNCVVEYVWRMCTILAKAHH